MNNFLALFNQPQFYLPFILWTLVWKGLALWKAATKKQLLWFVLLLVLNTMSIFEIIYIFFLNRRDLDNGKTLAFLNKKFQEYKK